MYLKLWYVFSVLWLATSYSWGQVRINELKASQSEHLLHWSAEGRAQVGPGIPWMDPAFDSRAWQTGIAPFGFGYGDINTDLQTNMVDRTPSLYLRKAFSLDTVENDRLIFRIDYDDAFVAYINGKEVARGNAGPPGLHLYAAQPAFNPAWQAGTPYLFDLGSATNWLQANTNVLAVQVHNQEAADDTLRVEASLVLDNGIATNVLSTYTFDDENNASAIYFNNLGTVNVYTNGVPSNDGWLKNRGAEQSDPGWNQLTMMTSIDNEAGITGKGLLYSITGQGLPQPATLRSPWIELGSVWPAGGITSNHLAETFLSFDYKAPIDFEIELTLESEGGLAALAGLPSVFGGRTDNSSVGYWRFEEVGASNGGVITAADSEFNSPALDAFPVNNPVYSSNVPSAVIYDPISLTTRSNQFSLNASANSSHLSVPDDVLLNTGDFTIEFFIYLEGEPNNYGSFVRRVTGSGNSSSSTRHGWQVDFDHSNGSRFGSIRARWDNPGTPALDWNRVVRGEKVWVDTPGGTGDPADYVSGDPSQDGDGINDLEKWFHIALTYDEQSRRTQIFTDGVAGQALTLNGSVGPPSVNMLFGKLTDVGHGLFIDEVRLSNRVLSPSEFLQAAPGTPTPEWKRYDIAFDQADPAAITDFLSDMNGGNHTRVRWALRLTEKSYSTAGELLQIDNVQFDVRQMGFVAGLVAEHDHWEYFPGLIEPSGGVWDPAILYDPQIDNEFSDWLELYNDSNQGVDLSGWRLTDDSDDPAKWMFPTGVTIAAQGHVLVLCDDLIPINAEYLHTNFKLSEGGEYLGLFDAQGSLVDEIDPDYPAQYPFYSYGRDESGSNWVYFANPSPAADNAVTGLVDRAKSVQFSVEGGFYSNAVMLVLSTTTSNATIRYTTDGSIPTESNGEDYSDPLNLDFIDANHGHVIRAIAFKPGYIPSRVRTHTYLIQADPDLSQNAAIIYTADEQRDFFKPYGILAIEGGVYGGNTWDANGPDDYNIAMNRGLWHERAFNLEWYYPDGRPGLNEEAGIRMAASNYSRPRMRFPNVDDSPWPASNTQKPSFNIYFRDDYGKEEINFPWLGDDYVTEFGQLRPRAGKNSVKNPFVEDEIMRRLYSDMGQESSLGRFLSLWINGELKGFYNVCERLREPFMQAHHKSNLEWDIRQVEEYGQGDGMAWNEMMDRLNQDMTILANYEFAAEMFDPVAVIDYFLVNIYGATWDWPQNNWVGARERSPTGKYRFYVWDAEGAFVHGPKSESHNTVANDLLGLNNSLSGFFKRVHESPEWRLLFADRVHKHFFHGGVLDDRETVNSHFGQLVDQVINEFQPLLTFMNNETVNRTNQDRWMNQSSGRRTYLLGPNGNHLRDNGLWPETEPPLFSQHGGMISAGFDLGITHSAPVNSIIYYTTDGSDPREAGGGISETAQPYVSAVPVTEAYTLVKARVRNGDSQEWSPLTEADFLRDTVSPDSDNLVVSEIMYHPVDPVDAELGYGYEGADFEYIQLMNIGPYPIDLIDVNIAGGIAFDFDFASIRIIEPGQKLVLVKNEQAFTLRYGTFFSTVVAGVFDNKLSNSSDPIRLETDGGQVIREFTYEDRNGWPEAADGLGPSLVLLDPASNPDHNDPANWSSSRRYNGTPGVALTPLTFSVWQEMVFTTNEMNVAAGTLDPDSDGMNNYLEFIFGGNPWVADAAQRLPEAAIIDGYLTLDFSMQDNLAGLSVVPEVADSLSVTWQNGPAFTTMVSGPDIRSDGSVYYRVRDTRLITDGDRRYIRIRFDGL